MSNLEAAMLSDVGCVRTINQDRVFAGVESIGSHVCGLFCVADGMGGLSSGDYAASVAIQTLEQWWRNKLRLLVGYTNFNEAEINCELLSLFYDINQEILIYARKNDSMVGTTCSVLLIFNNRYYITHAGDSRVYMVHARFAMNKQIFQLTDDHTWQAKQIREGILSHDEIMDNPKKNKLTSCLGVFENPEIFTASDEIKGSTAFLMCSDGLYNAVSNHELVKMVARQSKCHIIANDLMRMAIKNKATDNVSFVVIKYIKR